MIRIGIVGSDNSHAEGFSKLVNFPFKDTGAHRYPDARVTCIFGLEEARTREVAEKGGIETVVSDPAEMIGQVDAVMVVFRHGDLHLRYALPFIRAGIPVWMDKPFCKSSEDARALYRACEEAGVPLYGGSTVKYIDDVAQLRALREQPPEELGKLHSVTLGFAAQLENEYGGLCFYGSHLAELCMTAFGFAPRSVSATKNGGAITATLNYEDIQVTLNFTPNHKYYAAVFGIAGIRSWIVDITDCYVAGFDEFYAGLKGGSSLPFERVYNPVRLIEAVLESAETGREIQLTF